MVLPPQASRKTKKKESGVLCVQRASSNVFSNFKQTQIQVFKEAFTLMDQNQDGFIDKEDLKDTYASWVGKINVEDDKLEVMLKEASGPINFTMFLNLFGERLVSSWPFGRSGSPGSQFLTLRKPYFSHLSRSLSVTQRHTQPPTAKLLEASVLRSWSPSSQLQCWPAPLRTILNAFKMFKGKGSIHRE
uniref:Myosin light chain 5 n=1 Tax=Castor canadensis TaxID=51338 RepID=A0A8B7VG98_CASCN|nr:myosin light chain 5 [Castor canadensis]